MDLLNIIAPLAAVLGAPGMSALAVRYMLNGSREAIRRIEHLQREMNSDLKGVDQRVSRIEGRLSK